MTSEKKYESVHRRRLARGFVGLAACLGVLFTTSDVRADPVFDLPPPLPLRGPGVAGQLTIAVSGQGLQVDRPGSYRLDGILNKPTGRSVVTLGVFGEPEPVLVATVGSAPDEYTRSNATLVYEFAVLSPPSMGCSYPHYAIGGPDCSVAVYADVFGFVSAQGGVFMDDPVPSFVVQATWALQNAQGFEIFSEGINSGLIFGSYNEVFERQHLLSLTANRVYRIRMDVNAEARAWVLPAGAQAYIDPIFTFASDVDPGFSFQFSPGIGNSRPTAAPEPASLGLLGVGVAALGLRRRRMSARGTARPRAELDS